MKKELLFDFLHYISSSNQRQENEVWKPTKNLTQILHKLIIVCEFFAIADDSESRELFTG